MWEVRIAYSDFLYFYIRRDKDGGKHATLFLHRNDISRMKYEDEIFNILLEADNNGLTIKKIARHVHHETDSLFERVDFREVYDDVRKIIYKESRNSCSFIERAPRHGYYRLNKNSGKYMQQMLQFDD